MNEKSKIRKFLNKLQDNKWITKLAYINYIFYRLNAINKSLQGNLATVIVDKLRADKILVSNFVTHLWQINAWRNLWCFPLLTTVSRHSQQCAQSQTITKNECLHIILK